MRLEPETKGKWSKLKCSTKTQTALSLLNLVVLVAKTKPVSIALTLEICENSRVSFDVAIAAIVSLAYASPLVPNPPRHYSSVEA